jgi:iron complex transport system ATP-binding protein
MSAGTQIALLAEQVSVQLGAASVVRDANIVVRPGELVALVGPNGAGKTTLMRALAGLIPADGRITLQGRALAALAPLQRARIVAYLPQGHVFHWPMDVTALVALGRTPHADPFSRPSPADRVAVEQALALTGLAPLATRSISTLSGGERARVALARALATRAPILLTDEPTASLDPRHQLIVMNLLHDLAREGRSVLAIIHDLTLAARFADRIVIMNGGRVVAEGPPNDALNPERLAEIFAVEAVTVHTAAGVIPIAQRPL